MLSDRQGNPVSGATSETVEHFDNAVRAFNIYRGDPVAMVDEAINYAPEFAMAYILKSYLFGLATEPEATAEAAAILVQAKMHASTDRELSHIAVLDCLLANNWTAAAVRLDQHNLLFPHDLVGIQAGHLMDFYRANARNLRDRIARILPQWSIDRPGYAVLLGMHAFGLEETGNYSLAESQGREAVAIDPLDCWGHHAVAHVLEMQGRAQDGVAWMTSREPHWSGDDNFFKIHNWWHKALYHLDLGQSEEVIKLYDTQVRGGSSGVALDLVDASALLWRMQLAGYDTGCRWEDVATAWDDHADGKLYPFNDWHAAMAYLAVDRHEDVDKLIAQYRSVDIKRDETARWAQSIGLPLIEGFKAFWQGDYENSVKNLHGARYMANAFGGSHAQRDIIDWTLTEAAIRSGDGHVAEAYAQERIALKPHSPVNKRFLGRARSGSVAPVLAA